MNRPMEYRDDAEFSVALSDALDLLGAIHPELTDADEQYFVSQTRDLLWNAFPDGWTPHDVGPAYKENTDG